MGQLAHNVAQTYYTYLPERPGMTSNRISCNWQMLRGQLLAQWRQVTARELDSAGPDRYRIANLIEHKYGISARLVENYLRNFERTMPLSGNS